MCIFKIINWVRVDLKGLDNYICALIYSDMLDYFSGNLHILFNIGDTVNTTMCASIPIDSKEFLSEKNKTFYAVLTSSYEDIVVASPTVTLVIISDNRKGICIQFSVKSIADENFLISTV